MENTETLAQTLYDLYGQVDKQIAFAETQKDYGINTVAELFKKGFNVDGASGRPAKPYSQVEWVWICVNTILNVCQDIQPLISTADDKIVESGPGWDLFFSNPEYPFSDFLRDILGNLLLYRECYLIFAKKDNIAPMEILVAGRDKVKPDVQDGILRNYTLTIGSRQHTLAVEDVHPLIGFNPYDKYRGIGPVDAAKLAISSSYQATQYNESTMANGARIGSVLTVPAGVKLDPDEIALLKSQFKHQHSGAHNAGNMFVASGGVDIKTVTQTMAELEMIDLRSFDARTICAVFGVPPELVGLNSEAQYAHGPAQQRFLMYTIAPLLSFIGSNLTFGVLHRFRFRTDKHKSVKQSQSKIYCGTRISLKVKMSYRAARQKAVMGNQALFFWFDTDSHPAIQEMLQDRTEKNLKYVDKGVTLNQIIEVCDLPFDTEKLPHGDEHWISMGQTPARWILEAGPEAALAEPDLPEEEIEEEDEEGKGIYKHPCQSVANQKADEQVKLRLWKKYTTSWAGIEKQMAAEIRKLLLSQQRDLLAKLKKAWQQNQDKSIKAADDIIAQVAFNLRKENGRIKVINKVFFKRASDLGLAQSLNEATGAAGDDLAAAVKRNRLDPAIKNAMSVSSHKISKVNKTTADKVARSLRTGLEKGEGLNELSARIRSAVGTSRNRARSIARTQVSGGVSAGRHTGFKAAGIKLKSWLSARDNNVRDAHKQAEAAYSKGININQPFIVGGEALMYPGDPAGSAAMIINCRCLQMAIAEGRTASVSNFDRINFMHYDQLKTLLNED